MSTHKDPARGSEPTDPVIVPVGDGVERTDPGLVKQKDRRIGEAGEIPLPDAVNFIDPEHASRFMRWCNEQAIQVQNVMIGGYSFFVEWYVSIAKLFMKFPMIGGIFSLVLIVFLEEKFSEHPYLSNAVKYYYYKEDPEAAAMIFAEREVDPDPIGTGIKATIEKATKAYMESPEYRQLQEEVALYTRYQYQRGTYISTGMTDELADLDAEMEMIRAERKAKKAAVAAGASTTEVTYSPVAQEPVHKQGQSIDKADPETEDAPAEPVDEQLPPEDANPDVATGDGEKAKAERRKGEKQDKIGDDVVDRARREAEKLLPP